MKTVKMKLCGSILSLLLFSGISVFSPTSAESDLQAGLEGANKLTGNTVISSDGNDKTILQKIVTAANNKTEGFLYTRKDKDISDVQGFVLAVDGLSNGKVIPKEGSKNNALQNFTEMANIRTEGLLYQNGTNGAKP